MKRLRNLLIVSVGFLVLALTLTMTDVGRTVAQSTGECIRICTDDSDAPLSTRINGAVEIASSPRNAVRTREALLVTDVFQKEVKITLAPNQVLGQTSFTVPQSRLLVIDGFAGFAHMGHVLQVPVIYFRTVANGDPATHFVFAQVTNTGWFLNNLALGSKAYADPDSTVVVYFEREDGKGTATMSLTFTGHYIDQ